MAGKALNEAGIAFDAPRRGLQFAKRPDGPIPVPGGSGQLGVFNVIGPVMSDDITAGASFILAAEFTPEGPRRRAIPAYSNSTHVPPHHVNDQPDPSSQQQWIALDSHHATLAPDPTFHP